jgi:hypothetical protein
MKIRAKRVFALFIVFGLLSISSNYFSGLQLLTPHEVLLSSLAVSWMIEGE